jgi:hypothetical protein
MASIQEKKDIIFGSGGKMVEIMYIDKKTETPQQIRIKPKNANPETSPCNAPFHMTAYDMTNSFNRDPRIFRCLIVPRIAWAIVDGVLYDFRKKNFKNKTNFNVSSYEEIDNNPSRQVLIDRNADPDRTYVGKVISQRDILYS